MLERFNRPRRASLRNSDVDCGTDVVGFQSAPKGLTSEPSTCTGQGGPMTVSIGPEGPHFGTAKAGRWAPWSTEFQSAPKGLTSEPDRVDRSAAGRTVSIGPEGPHFGTMPRGLVRQRTMFQSAPKGLTSEHPLIDHQPEVYQFQSAPKGLTSEQYVSLVKSTPERFNRPRRASLRNNYIPVGVQQTEMFQSAPKGLTSELCGFNDWWLLRGFQSAPKGLTSEL